MPNTLGLLHREHSGFNQRETSASHLDGLFDSLRDVEPDLELEDWRIPALRPFGNMSPDDDGPRCPNSGGRLIFQAFHRIRPPPLTQRASFFSSLTIRR